MKKMLLIFVLLFIVLTSFSSLILADDEDDLIYNSKHLNLALDITNTINIVPETSDYEIDYITASLSFFPRNDKSQKVSKFETKPEGNMEDSRLLFTWDSPTKTLLPFSITSEVLTENVMTLFTDVIPFPAQIPDEQLIYTQPTEKIDSDKIEIIKTASEIVAGETDMFSAVYHLAWWANNEVVYDLSTLTAEVSQSSSWVLKNKIGVCDEITNLFIALCRSVGIPARFVSGISYTNSDLFLNKWGPHGWAEVYFPRVGWVPFDVTYGEFGFVDASHIKLKTSLDSDDSSVGYEWKSWGADISPNQLDFDVTILSTEGSVEDAFTFDANILKDKVGFGSYNLIEVDIINPTDSYVPAQVFISKTEGITLLEDYSKEVLLFPKSSSKVFWKVKVDNSLDFDFIYTFPMEVYTQRDQRDKISFKSEKNYPVYEEYEIDQYILMKSSLDQKEFNSDVSLTCTSKKEIYYSYEDPSITCILINEGNVFHDSLKICLDDCKIINLPINSKEEVSLSFNADTPGEFKKSIFITGEDLTITNSVNITVLSEPSILIKNISSPSLVEYGNRFNVSFSISPSSHPKNTVVFLSNKYSEKIWRIDELSSNINYVVTIDASDLSKVNKFVVEVDFEDMNGRSYSVSDDFTIHLDDLTFAQKADLGFKESARFVDSHFILSLILVSIVIFLIILLIILKGKGKDRYLDNYRDSIVHESTKDMFKDMRKEELDDEKLFR